MANQKFSKFYYGHLVDESNRAIDFDEGAGNLTALINPKAYTLTEFAVEVGRAMSDIGTQDYIVTVNRETRQLTISAENNFSLLCLTGNSKGTTALILAGFSQDSDTPFGTTHVSSFGSGSEYKPQLWLQKYTPFYHWIESAGATKSKSAAGVVEIVSFGQQRKMECLITYVTNKEVGNSSVWESNPNGVQDFLDFLLAITQMQRIEFMEDRNNVSDYQKCILESSPGYKQGTGFKLKELTGSKLPDFYSYGPLVFEEVI